MKTGLIAPCGMDCGICSRHLREKDGCPGCRKLKDGAISYCDKCVIRNCDFLKKGSWKFCSSKCESFPCVRLRNLDKRYRRYEVGLIGNLKEIEKFGVRKFVEGEKKKWSCKCGGVVCVHGGFCLECGRKKSFR